MASMKWSTDKEQGLFSYDIQLRSHLAIHSVVSLKLAAAWLVLSLVNFYSQSSSCKAKGTASSGLSLTGSEAKRRRVRPSVAVLQHFSSTRVFSSINVMLECHSRFTVVFTVKEAQTTKTCNCSRYCSAICIF